MAPTTPRDRQRFLADLHEIDRRSILEAMAYQDELSLRADGTPGDPRTPKKPCPARAPGKHVSVCRPHMSAGIHGRADARSRSFEPDDGAAGRAGSKSRQAAAGEPFSLHLEYAVQSARGEKSIGSLAQARQCKISRIASTSSYTGSSRSDSVKSLRTTGLTPRQSRAEDSLKSWAVLPRDLSDSDEELAGASLSARMSQDCYVAEPRKQKQNSHRIHSSAPTVADTCRTRRIEEDAIKNTRAAHVRGGLHGDMSSAKREGKKSSLKEQEELGMRVYLEQQAELLRRCAEEDAPHAEECVEEDAMSPVPFNGISSWINCCSSSGQSVAQQSNSLRSAKHTPSTTLSLWDYVGAVWTPRDRSASAPGQRIDPPSTRQDVWGGLFSGDRLEEKSRGEGAGAAIQRAPEAGKQADTGSRQGTPSKRRARGNGSAEYVFQGEEMQKYDWIMELGEAAPLVTSPPRQLAESVAVSVDSSGAMTGATPQMMLVCTLHEFEGADLENRLSARGLRPDLMSADGRQRLFPEVGGGALFTIGTTEENSKAPADWPGDNPTLSSTESEPTRSTSAHSLESAED